MRRMVAFALGCVVTRGVLVAQDRPRTTTEIVQYALEQNRELQAARQRVEEAQALLRQAGVRLNPTLEFEGATGRPFGTHGEQEYSAGYFQPIETAGKRNKRTAVGQQSVMSAEAEVIGGLLTSTLLTLLVLPTLYLWWFGRGVPNESGHA